ncbi:glycoside hydrolase 43 family protein [Alistipes sp. OttesenSCG-928-L06]|nr:glycoside hydrolase 43 family protein [Alistipes sp. OttesenSCG-928-L06]
MLTACLLAFAATAFAQTPYVSKVWVADNGNGTYTNPIIYADYSDPDVCRAGDDYWMTASSFVHSPGLPILHSKDMVNWTIVNHALPRLVPHEVFNTPQPGWGVWAPAIRYHNNEFYIYWGDPDFGIYMVKTADPRGRWSDPVLVKAGKGLIDACPLWDDDGRAYVVHAYAGSRAGVKSVLAIFEMTPDGTKAITESRLVFDGHDGNDTVEGAKFHKHDGYYWIFAPAGGVKPGWQLAMRSKEIYGPYEARKILAQGNAPFNGPHQGAWVDTPSGEHWFYNFQDVGPVGRLVHLQPLNWVNGWPVAGIDADGDGCGEPVVTHRKPNVGGTYPIQTPQENDEFDGLTLGLQWQWQANYQPIWAYFAGDKGYMRLFSIFEPENRVYGNLFDVPNMVMQKFPAPDFSAVTKVTFTPNVVGERAGFIVFGRSYAMLALENTKDGLVLSQVECKDADRKGKETVRASQPVNGNTFYLKVTVKEGNKCTFSFSENGRRYTQLGNEFLSREGVWVGSKVGYFTTAPRGGAYGGWMDVDWFRIEK